MSSVIDIIKHYQRSIEKYTEDEKRILHCIGKLDALPIKVKHLQETGIGRTVNSLRKYEGQVGHVARTLVAKWKEMVTAESSNSEVEENSDNEQQPIDELNEDSKEYQEKENESNCHEEEEENEDNFKEIEQEEEEEEENLNQDRDVENSYYSSHHKKKKHKSKHDKHDKHEKHSNDSSSDRHSRNDNHHTKQTNYDNSNSSKDKDKDKVKLKDSDTVDTSSSKHHKEKRKTEDKEEHRKHKKKSHKSDRDSSKKSSHHKSSSSSSNNSKHSKNLSEELETNFKKEKSTDAVDTSKSNKHKKDHSSKHSTSSSDQIGDSVTKENMSCDEKKSESPVNSFNETKHKSSKNESKKSSSSSSSHKSSKHKHNKSSHKMSVAADTSSESANKIKSEKKHKESKKDSSTNKRKLVDIDIMANTNLSSDDEGINSFSGTSFAEALGGFETPAKKKLKTVNSDSSSPKTSIKDQPINTSLSKEKYDLLSTNTKLPQLNLDINLPEITPNYQPLPSSETLWSITQNKKRDDETLSVAISSKNQRTKVYSGGHRNTLGIVPSLFDLCIRILQDNIDALAYTGGVPYSILYPVLEKASAEQLFTLENYNAYLLEDTDELWEKHCKREFRGHIREELESWREAYSRFLVEREEKLKMLTANIKQSIDKSLPIRQTKLAYVDSVVKPPRAIARKQAKYGTANVANNKPAITPSSRVAALASSVSNISVPNPGARAATSHNSSTISKPKKAPLMQKTLALIKSTNRYRR